MSYFCKRCEKPKHRERGPRRESGIGWYYVDSSGRRWNGKTCPECWAIGYLEQYRRSRGHKSIDDVQEPRRVLSRSAERRAAEYFIGLGHDVELTRLKGPDLILDQKIKVEVKTVLKDKRAKSYFVREVTPARQRDDLIAFVLPNKCVIVESMQEHLSKCSASGTRTVTKMVLGG